MFAIRFLTFLAVAIACVFAAEERVKKDVLLGTAPYAYSGYAAPLAYSAGYAAPAAYSAYSAYPYTAGYAAPAAYSAYSAYPYAAAAYRTGLYY